MKQFIKFDSEELYKIFRERGLQSSKLAKEMGVNQSYFSNAKKRGTINEMAVLLLESKYNIPRSRYVIAEGQKKEEDNNVEQKTNITEEMKKELYEILYSAVYEGVKKALNE